MGGWICSGRIAREVRPQTRLQRSRYLPLDRLKQLHHFVDVALLPNPVVAWVRFPYFHPFPKPKQGLLHCGICSVFQLVQGANLDLRLIDVCHQRRPLQSTLVR